VNSFVYTTSPRVKVFHSAAVATTATDEWRLSLNPAEMSDDGLYECQVSTTPHTSHFIALKVIGKL
jgi:hypothetical protein